jgi:hypothetical protein
MDGSTQSQIERKKERKTTASEINVFNRNWSINDGLKIP